MPRRSEPNNAVFSDSESIPSMDITDGFLDNPYSEIGDKF